MVGVDGTEAVLLLVAVPGCLDVAEDGRVDRRLRLPDLLQRDPPVLEDGACRAQREAGGGAVHVDLAGVGGDRPLLQGDPFCPEVEHLAEGMCSRQNA